MSETLTSNIRKASFGFADDFLSDKPHGDVPVSESVAEDGDWMQRAATEVVRVDMLAFLSGTTYYALPLADIDTVVDERSVTPYPTRRDYVLGGIQHANLIYPVVDLRVLLGSANQAEAPTELRRARAKIAIVAQGGRTVGFRLEQVRRAYRIPIENLRPMPDNVRVATRHIVESIFDADDKVFHVMSVSSIFRALGESI